MSRGAERSANLEAPRNKQLHQSLAVFWHRLEQVLENPQQAGNFAREIRSWWPEVFRKAIYRGIGVHPGVKKRQLVDNVAKWDVVAPSRATRPVLSFEEETASGQVKYILDQRVDKGLSDQVVFYVDPAERMKGPVKIVATRTSQSISENGTRPAAIQIIQSAQIEFLANQLSVRLEVQGETRTAELTIF